MFENPRFAESWSRPVVFGALLAGALVRVAAAMTLGPHIDEAESVLAARMVAEGGWPILPSGLVFLQGLTLSYLLPLFDRSSDPFDFTSFRLASAFFGSLTVVAVYPLARAFGAPRWVASLAAVCLAFDPVSIQWSALIRPYALLQLTTVVLLTTWMRALEAPTPRRLVGMSLLFAFGVFTHVGIALMAPGMALVTWLWYGRALLTERRDLTWTFASFAIPAAIFFGINTLTGASSSGSHGGLSFIGDHTLSFASVVNPQLDPWRALFQQAATRDFLPFLVVAAGTVLAVRHTNLRTFALLITYATPVLLVAAFTSDSLSRYLLHIQPMSWIILGLGIHELLAFGGQYARAWRALAYVVLGMCLVYVFDGTASRIQRHDVDPDYARALRWIEPQHTAGDPVLAAMTSVTWFSLIPQADVYFLAGSEDAARTGRYVRAAPDGSLMDYWSGVPALASTATLCTFLEAHPNSWLLVDDERLRSNWAFGGPMQEVIRGASAQVFKESDAASVYRSLVPAAWSPKATEACVAALSPPPVVPEE